MCDLAHDMVERIICVHELLGIYANKRADYLLIDCFIRLITMLTCVMLVVSLDY